MMTETVNSSLRSIPWWVWAGVVFLLIAGGYLMDSQGIIYGGLFFVGGILILWADFRDRNPSEQETLATEEGLTPLNWPRWVALVVVGVTVVYGLSVAQAPSAVFLAVYAFHSVIKYSDQLFPNVTKEEDR